MTAIMGAMGALASPSSSWLKFVTIGLDGAFNRGFSSLAPAFGAVALTDRVGGRVVTRFVYEADTDEFNFQIDETNSAGFTFTSLVVESIPGFSYVTLNRASAVEYSGFPIKGWIWSGAGLLWTTGIAGETRTIQIRR